MTREYKNDFFDRAEALGAAQGKAEALVTFLRAMDIELSPEQHELVASCLDHRQLDTWLTRAATAGAADDVFEE